MICPREIHFRKVGATGKELGVAFYVWDCLSTVDSASVQGSAIYTRSPAAILLEQEMEAHDHGPSTRRDVLSRSMESN